MSTDQINSTSLQTNDETHIEVEEASNGIKGVKSLKHSAEVKSTKIEESRIDQGNMKDLISKFNAPVCKNCASRKADRICIHFQCGSSKYMTLICGKCHSDSHAKAISKPEISIEEFFDKLVVFSKESKCILSKQSPKINPKCITSSLSQVDSLRNQLENLKSRIRNVAVNYQVPRNMRSELEERVIKTLSQTSYENITENLLGIKRSVFFKNNKFEWNAPGRAHEEFLATFKELRETIDSVNKQTESYFGSFGNSIDLSQIQIEKSNVGSYFGFNMFSHPSNDPNKAKEVGGIERLSDSTVRLKSEKSNCQYFLRYPLNREKKYRLRFKFDTNPMSFIMIGVMPLSKVHVEWLYSIENENFIKRFFSNNQKSECSRILKGKELSILPVKGTEIEMRICIAQSYIDFADFPSYDNVNANHEEFKLKQSEEYVIAIAFNSNKSIVLQAFEEIEYFQEHI